MDSGSGTNDITHDFPPFFKAYKDGHIERYVVSDPVPPTADPTAAIQSKDAVISPETGVVARIFFPKAEVAAGRKLPLLLHFHGGGFCIGSALDAITRDHLTVLVSEANTIAVSVEYRLAPEQPLPTAYDDCFGALQWVASHAGGCGPDPILNSRADLGRVFVAGESAGANLAHNVAVRSGVSPPPAGVNIVGLVLVHPFFGGKGPDKMYKYLCPSSSGCGDDPKVNPGVDPNLRSMRCERVLVCVAEKDWLRERGEAYYETLRNSEWDGTVELEKNEGVDHCFHMFDATGEKAMALVKRIAIFINRV